MNIKTKIMIVVVLAFLLSTVVAAGILSSDESDGHVVVNGVINMTFHSSRTSPGQMGYVASIDYQNGTYYMDANQLEKIATIDPSAKQLYDYYEETVNGTIVNQDDIPNEYTVQVNNTDFSFDYKGGVNLYGGSNQTVITELYYANGTKMNHIGDE